jgi:hypothetical protein
MASNQQAEGLKGSVAVQLSASVLLHGDSVIQVITGPSVASLTVLGLS